ncbi:hypothetical protein O3M35_010966 [Rhynocoris fuscipes]|uniref:Lethal(3)malignant brain tumor-like protein 3 n=1 Tax=Rhynocoris fuscipes TaxID=488301 RepID=A0AAW1D122_9HEMI
MNEESELKSADSSPGAIAADTKNGSTTSTTSVTSPSSTTSASQPEKRSLPLLYVQSPISKNLNSNELSNSFSVPKILPTSSVSSVPNGVVNGGKTIQAFVGTLINRKCQQKVLLTPVKPGQEKQAGVARLLIQGQRSVGQVTRLTATSTQSSGASTQSGSTALVIPSQGKQISASYVMSPVSSASSSTSPTTSTTAITTSTGSTIVNRPTLSIRNAVLIDASNNVTQNKSAQPNIIRQKITSDGKITVSSLLKPSGLPTSLLTKVLNTPPQSSAKISINSPNLQLRNEKDSASNVSSDIVLIEDDDDNSIANKGIEGSSKSKITGTLITNGVGDSNNDSTLEMEVKKVPSSPMLDRARKRKGLLAASEPPPAKVAKQQDKLKLLPGAEDFDPFKVVEWDPSGIGLLPGSNIKMTINELGMLTVAEDTLAERGATPATPVSDEDEGKSASKRGNELDSILCCVSCSCYGLPAEFYNASYCSIACRDTVLAQEEAIVKKIEQEKEENSDSDQKKKRSSSKHSEINRKNSTNDLSSINSNNNNSEDCTIESNESGNNRLSKKKSSVKSILFDADGENADDLVNNKKLPQYTDTIIKQNSINDEEYNVALIRAKKIVKKGKLIHADLKLPKPIKYTRAADIKAAAAQQDLQQQNNGEKTNLLVKNSKTDGKQQSADTSKIKSYKSPNSSSSNSSNQNESATNRTRSSTILRVHEVSQDLDCGQLMEIRSDKNDSSETDHFPWASYLQETGSRPAWVKLFKNPFPSSVNSFQVGHKLEAIDPEHQSNICVVTVSKIIGYRLKLHFDCYSDIFDFWVNVDSPNIFPSGFCSRHGISLCPPQGHSRETFNWLSYNSIWMATSAPTSCFPNYATSSTSPNLFRVGMKLEAVDRKNTFLVCVATVAGVIENRILVHFDSWGDVYDYWVDTSSPYIRPVGWCKENNHELTPPNGIKASEFSWPEYLEETKSEAAPSRAFHTRPHIDFRKGMKLEAVDKRAPYLLRVATIKEVLPYQIKIAFDGFPDHFGYWVDDDCPDIHPIGWAARTGHPLEPPPSINAPSPCPTPGCLGQGHMRSNSLIRHYKVEDCPYSIDNLNSEPIIPDRLTYISTNDDKNPSKPVHDVINLESGEESEDDIKESRWKWLGVREGVNKHNTSRESQKNGEVKKSSSRKIKRKKRRKVFNNNNNNSNNSSKNTSTVNPENKCEAAELNSSDINDPPLLQEKDALKWTNSEVIRFANLILGPVPDVQQLEKEEIDGKGLLMLTKDDLIYYLGFSPELAEKFCENIDILRTKVT